MFWFLCSCQILKKKYDFMYFQKSIFLLTSKHEQLMTSQLTRISKILSAQLTHNPPFQERSKNPHTESPLKVLSYWWCFDISVCNILWNESKAHKVEAVKWGVEWGGKQKDNLSGIYTMRSSLLDAKCRKANASLRWEKWRISHICTMGRDDNKMLLLRIQWSSSLYHPLM